MNDSTPRKDLFLCLQPPAIQSRPGGDDRSSFEAKPFGDMQQKASDISKKSTDVADDEKGSGWDAEDDWEGGGWGGMSDVSAATKAVDSTTSSEDSEKAAKKAEMVKKREERKQQRENMARERKAKGAGALKLGGVKKISKDSFD